MGGVKTDLYGETNIRRFVRLWEVSCTGVHGANRLASNSLSEAIVFGKRIADRARQLLEEPCQQPAEVPDVPTRFPSHVEWIEEYKLRMQKSMVRYVGVKRTRESLERALSELGQSHTDAGAWFYQAKRVGVYQPADDCKADDTGTCCVKKAAVDITATIFQSAAKVG